MRCTILQIYFDNFFFIFFFIPPMPPHVLVGFMVFPSGHGRSVTDFWGWDAHEAQLRFPDDVSGDIGGCSARRVILIKYSTCFTHLLSVIRSLSTVYTAIDICHSSSVDCLLARSGWRLLVMDSRSVWNMQSKISPITGPRVPGS